MLLSRAPPYFGRHVNPLVPAAFAAPAPEQRRVDVTQAAGREIIAESLSQHDEKHVVPTPISGIKVERRRKRIDV
jgi:hypothetical protein